MSFFSKSEAFKKAYGPLVARISIGPNPSNTGVIKGKRNQSFSRLVHQTTAPIIRSQYVPEGTLDAIWRLKLNAASPDEKAIVTHYDPQIKNSARGLRNELAIFLEIRFRESFSMWFVRLVLDSHRIRLEKMKCSPIVGAEIAKYQSVSR
jgi:hypothetical protein